jgi:hypothetical protein
MNKNLKEVLVKRTYKDQIWFEVISESYFYEISKNKYSKSSGSPRFTSHWEDFRTILIGI